MKDLKTRDDLNPEVDVHPDLAHWLKTVKGIDFTSHGFIWIRCSGCKKYYAPCAKDLYEESEEYFCMAECMKEN